MIESVHLNDVKILITSYCNCNCTHCYQANEKNKFMLSFNQIKDIIDFSVAHFAQKITLSGGEIFTHPHIYEIIDYCLIKGIKIRLTTNCTKIDIDYFKQCKRKDLLSFLVSIDGLKDAHDSRRGTGMFDLTMHNVRELYALNIPIEACMTLDICNYKDIIEILKVEYFSNVSFSPTAYTGAFKDTQLQFNEEFDAAVRIIYNNKKEAKDKNSRCHMFPSSLSFKYDGFVYPCSVARDYDMFRMGNLNEKSIEEIIEDFLETQESKILLNYKCNDIEKCNQCEYSDKCSRGCRMRAFKVNGDIMTPDPFLCKIYRNDYEKTPFECLFWGDV